MRDQHLYLSPAITIFLGLGSLQITITLTESTLLIFLQSGVEKLLVWPVIEPTTLGLSSQSGAFDHLATTIPI